MAKVSLKFNMDGFRKLRTSPEMQAILMARANQIAARANSVRPGFYEVEAGENNTDRSRVFVSTAGGELAGKAIRHEQRAGTLLRAAGGG